MTDQQHYLKFKKILEVYCKHAEYISERAKQGEAKSPSANYRETHKKDIIIKNLVKYII